jgi:flagellar basal-body rod modification protein FlgD
MTSQLAQISTVDGIERLNATLQALMSNSNESSVLQAAALVGHDVLVPGNGLRLDKGAALAGIELSEPADRVQVTIKDSNGAVVRTLTLGPSEAGSQVFEWDGKSDGGAQSADGRYSFGVEAERGESKFTATGLQLGSVSSIVRTGGEVRLNVGTLGAFGMDAIRLIR